MIIEIKVIPKSSKVEVVQLNEKSYKIKLTEAPEKGKANKQCIEVLASYFNLKKEDIKIIQGTTSRYKKVYINNSTS